MSLRFPDDPGVHHSWQVVGVLEFSRDKSQYLVQKADQHGRVRDQRGKPVALNGGTGMGKFSPLGSVLHSLSLTTWPSHPHLLHSDLCC